MTYKQYVDGEAVGALAEKYNNIANFPGVNSDTAKALTRVAEELYKLASEDYYY